MRSGSLLLFFFLFFFVPVCMLSRKVTKLWYTRNLCCNLPKIQEKRQSLRVFCLIHANWIANCEGPDQTTLLGAVWSGSALFAKARLSEKIQDHYGNYSKLLTRWLTMWSLMNISMNSDFGNFATGYHPLVFKRFFLNLVYWVMHVTDP